MRIAGPVYLKPAANVGAWLITPGMTQTEMDAVDTSLGSLVRDVGSSEKADDRFRKELGEFARGWLAFKERNAGWFARGTSGVYEQVQEYKTKVNQWRTKFQQVGGKITAPALLERKPVDWTKAALIGGGATVGILALVYLIRR